MLQTAFVQAQYDGPIPAGAMAEAERADRAALDARPARIKRLASIYDNADRAAGCDAGLREMANDMLAHWLYVRATAGTPYPWNKMANDFNIRFRETSGLRHCDVRALPHSNRAQIARRAVIRAYAAYRAERERRRVDLFAYGALGIAAE